ncbi:MAG TPA: ATP-grasp domain-containing protein, partial [Solirubrobacteraceae bacterium]|nr:ATP-grasp domain-containing protein [Solirubrobacteraceae bacterium]
MRDRGRPVALVMGGFDIVRPLALAGVRSAVFTRPDDPVRHSRHVVHALPWHPPREEPRAAMAALLEFAAAQPEPPVLFPPDDASIVFASRERATLAPALRLCLGGPELIEDLLDKARFRALAERLELPVPRSRRLVAQDERAPELDLRYPLVLKPAMRGRPWEAGHADQKAVLARTPSDLAALWPRLVEISADLIAQEYVPGPETRIESFHAYVDESGAVAGAFCGRKVRTVPPQYGESTVVAISDARDVDAAGREAVERMGLRGVCKLDFKRAPDGRLWLLEVNPRFNLWHHPGALAGVNLPALVFADLTGSPRPPAGPARAGVRWCDPLADLRGVRQEGRSVRAWAGTVLRAEALA